MPIGVLSSYFACFQHFSYFCSDFLCLLCKDSEKLVHFGSFYETTLFVHFLCYKTASILALASSTSELLMERR